MEPWQWITVISGTLVGIGIIWRVVGKLVDATRAYPVLMDIAEQFKPNGGTSLHDRIEALTEMQAEQSLLLDNISQQLENKLT